VVMAKNALATKVKTRQTGLFSSIQQNPVGFYYPLGYEMIFTLSAKMKLRKPQNYERKKI
jgi:hypothetical protein